MVCSLNGLMSSDASFKEAHSQGHDSLDLGWPHLSAGMGRQKWVYNFGRQASTREMQRKDHSGDICALAPPPRPH